MNCILCLKPEVAGFLDLGVTSLANGYLAEEQLGDEEPSYPLKIGFCNNCAHVQLIDKVPPKEMFVDYLYVSSASDTLRDHLKGLANLVVQRLGLTGDDLVIDVGCNDGTLLGGFKEHGIRGLGVDPAENLALLSEGSNIERFVGFFGAQTADQIANTWGEASVITATNTFPHVPDLHDFLRGVLKALKPRGVLVLEMHYLRDLIEQGAFDTIYHEHVSYWSLTAIKTLFEKFGMEVIEAERLPIHHGQIRVFVQRKGHAEIDQSVVQILLEEEAANIGALDTYKTFANKALTIKHDLARTLTDLKRMGKTVVGYGAPAKACTLLEFLGLDNDVIGYIVDRSTLKQGRFIPGLHVPIVHPNRLLEDQPDYALLFAWNFVDEILEQQSEYRRRGGKFITPFPSVEII